MRPRAAARCAIAMLAVWLCAQCAASRLPTTPDPSSSPAATQRVGISGDLRTLPALRTRDVAPRRVDVWLPPGYSAHPRRRYPVLYVHDGQNLFDPATAYGGVDWGIDEAMNRLIAQGAVRPAIVVGIWNTPERLAEYTPQQAVHGPVASTGIDGFAPLPRAALRGDAYLDYVVRTLKPAIDARFRTRRGRDDTFALGSSMGGLAALYAVARRPDVFGGAAALSTHWPAADGATVPWLAAHLPAAGAHRFYFDRGTQTLDAAYAPYQTRMDVAMRNAGFRPGVDWITHVEPGAAHDERAWRARIDAPLRFLLRP